MTKQAHRPLVPDGLRDDIEGDRRGQEYDDPVDLESAGPAPHVAVEAGEEERREMPDGLGGQSSRRPPPAKPQPIAKGSAPHSRRSRRDAEHDPTIAPA
jgi:hypothetical protein